MEDSTLARHLRDITKLKIEIKQLNLKINKKNTEIIQLKEYCNQIKEGQTIWKV